MSCMPAVSFEVRGRGSIRARSPRKACSPTSRCRQVSPFRGSDTSRAPPPRFISSVGLQQPRASFGSKQTAVTQGAEATRPDSTPSDLAARARAALATPDSESCSEISGARKRGMARLLLPLKGRGAKAVSFPEDAKNVKSARSDSKHPRSDAPQGPRSTIISPTLPIESLLLCLDDTSCKTPRTPNLTPHALTETALKKSEALLAQLTALGLSDQDSFGFGMAEHDDDDQSIGGGLCPSKSGCSSPAARSSFTRKATDTVEVPVVLLDMFVETWTKYRNLQVASPWLVDDMGFAPEPEPEETSSKASTTDPVDSVEESLTSASEMASPLMSPRPDWPDCRTDCMSPRPDCCTPPSPLVTGRVIFPKRAPSPTMSRQTLDANAIQRRMVCPRAPCNLQVPPRMSSPVLSPRLSFRASSARMPGLVVESHPGCRPVSCTVQQTVTVTNTVHVHL